MHDGASDDGESHSVSLPAISGLPLARDVVAHLPFDTTTARNSHVHNFIILRTMAARRVDHICAKVSKPDRSYSIFDDGPHEIC